jgi:large subunit ribosomal protein L32
MAVHKSRVTRSRRGMRRSHNSLTKPTLAIDETSGETHRRHHVSKTGYYRGKQVIVPKAEPVVEEADKT